MGWRELRIVGPPLLFALVLIIGMVYGAFAGRDSSTDWKSRLAAGSWKLNSDLVAILSEIDDETEVDVVIAMVNPEPDRGVQLEREVAATMVALRPEATMYVRTDGWEPNVDALRRLPMGEDLRLLRIRILDEIHRRESEALNHALYEELREKGETVRSRRDSRLGINAILSKRTILALAGRDDIQRISLAVTAVIMKPSTVLPEAPAPLLKSNVTPVLLPSSSQYPVPPAVRPIPMSLPSPYPVQPVVRSTPAPVAYPTLPAVVVPAR